MRLMNNIKKSIRSINNKKKKTKKKKNTHISYPTQASVYTDVLTFMRVKQAMNV